jgi:atypical dual specificity phosphatase
MTQQNLAGPIFPPSEGDAPAPVDIPARFMVPSGEEFTCRITAMSTREVHFSCEEKPQAGEKLVVYAKGLGRFVAFVEREETDSIIAKLELSDAKSARIAQRLAWHVEQRASGKSDRRKNARIVPIRQLALVKLATGVEHFARINNVSADGVELAINIELEVDSEIAIDSRLATVKRLFDGGAYAEFLGSETLACRGYGVAFGAKVVLADITLTLPARGVTVLMGPAGTGKSTLLRSVAGLFARNEIFSCWGEVHYLGEYISVGNAPALVKQRIEMTQRPALESLLYHVSDSKLTAEAQRQKILEWLEQFQAADVVEHLEQPFVDLEPLLQRKVAILSEAAARPALLMIDEPTSGLADEEAADLLQLIKDISRQMAVLVVLHNQKEARSVAQSIILLAGGRIQEYSPTEQFFVSTNPIVERFVTTGSCAVPAPDAMPETLAEDAPPPPPLPEPAMRSLDLHKAQAAETVAAEQPGPSAEQAESPKHTAWLNLLPKKPPNSARGPLGFHWIVEGRLAGAPRPGAVHDVAYELDLIKDAGVTTLITLTETNLPQGPLLLRGLDNVHLPIPDGKAPTIESTLILLSRMRKLMESGRVLLVHCLQGVGRTGTILASCLIEGGGMSANEAISHLRSLNPEYVKTKEQEEFLATFEQAVRTRS